MSKQLYEIADLEWETQVLGERTIHRAKSPVCQFSVTETPRGVWFGRRGDTYELKVESVEGAKAAASAQNRELMLRGLKPVTCNQDPCTGE